MRKTMFGDTVIESEKDDLGMEVDSYETYATIREDEDDGGFYFEIQENESGDQVASSESFFKTAEETREYLRGWYDHKNIDVI